MSQARIVRRTVSIVSLSAVMSLAGLARAAGSAPARAEAQAPAALGIAYAGWKGDYRSAAKRLETIKAIGFQIV